MRTVNIMRVIWLCCYFISGIKANLKNRGEVGGNTDVRDNIENELSDMRIGFQRGNLTRMLDIQAKNNPEKSSTQHWTSLCCSGSLTFDCNDWILKEAELKKKEKLTIQGLTTEFVFEDHVGTNTNSYVYRDVKKHYEVILTKSKDTYGYYGQIISNCEDNNYVIEYCGTDRDGGELHGIKKIARSSEEFDTDTDAGTKLLKSGKLFTKGTNNNTLQHQKTLTRNKRKTGNIQKFDIKFYYTKSFEDHTVDVNGFIDQVVSSINQAFINSKVSVRVEAHCSELAPLSDSDPNLFQQFYTMKGTDTKLKGDADAAQLLYHLKTPHSKAHKRSTKFCNAFDVQNRMISIVEKDCALGILSSSHAIGHNLGIHHEEDSKAKFNSGHFSIMSRLKNRLNCFPTPFCLATNTGWAPTNVMQAEDIKVKAGFVVNGRRFKRSPNLQRKMFSLISVGFCQLEILKEAQNYPQQNSDDLATNQFWKCGIANRVIDRTRIVNGKNAEMNEYPWQVGLSTVKGGNIVCGGSIISSKTILTAAHCVPLANWVAVEEYEQGKSHKEGWIKVCAKEKHGSYNAVTTNYDFAVLHLCKEIAFTMEIAPVCLPTTTGQVSQYEGMNAVATGWGTLISGGAQAQFLQEVTVKTMKNTECCNSSKKYKCSQITNSMICAAAPGKDACQGDSGGPLVVKEGFSDTLVGITSWGYGCAEADAPGVYARVTDQLQWIKDRTRGTKGLVPTTTIPEQCRQKCYDKGCKILTTDGLKILRYFRGSLYHFHRRTGKRISWKDAEKNCKDWFQGHTELSSIHSLAEYNYIATTIFEEKMGHTYWR